LTFNLSSFVTNKYSIWLNWITPTIAAGELVVDAYNIYWDEGHLSSGNFSKLTTISVYQESFYNVTVANTNGKLMTG
jgi:hypothetical protein